MCSPVVNAQRVLFLLDGSGSMNATWQDQKKWTIASQTLLQLLDSMQEQNPNVEVGLRVFGHQHPRDEYNCTDTRLEIDFSTFNRSFWANRLRAIKPQGHTPISYSLQQSATDFPDSDKQNIVIILTDGLENCEGNPCEASKALQEKGITVHPYIIGLAIADSLHHKFDCIGSFVNAKDPEALRVVSKEVIKKSLEPTTWSLVVSDTENRLVHNLGFLLVRERDHSIHSAYMLHTDASGTPDTLGVDPRGSYRLYFASHPTMPVRNIVFKPNQHNALAYQMPFNLVDGLEGVRMNRKGLGVAGLQKMAAHYVTGTWQEVLPVLPFVEEPTEIKTGKPYVPSPAKTGILAWPEKLRDGLHIISLSENQTVFPHADRVTQQNQINLRPGTYLLVYRKPDQHTEKSKQKMVNLKEGQIVNITFAP